MKKVIINIWNYFRPSWEDHTGSFSYKRLSQYIFLSLFIYLAIKGPTSVFAFHTLLLIAVLFALTAVIITVPQLLNMMKEAKGIVNITSNTSTSDTTTKEIPIQETSTLISSEQPLSE